MEMSQPQIKSLLYLVDAHNESVRNALKFECQGEYKLATLNKIKAEVIEELINELGYSKCVKHRVNVLPVLRFAGVDGDVQAED